MLITIEITKCRQCRFIDHSGQFTKGGAKDVCNGPNVINIVAKLKQLSTKGDDYYHWKHRVLKFPDKTIPAWCPLKHGEKY